MRLCSSYLALGIASAVISAAACGGGSTDINDIDLSTTGDSSAASSTTSPDGGAVTGSAASTTGNGQAAASTTGGVAAASTTGSAAASTTGSAAVGNTDGGVANVTSTNGGVVTSSTDGMVSTTGDAAASTSTTGVGGAAGSTTGGGTTGDATSTTGAVVTGPYEPRTGSFKVLVNSITRGFEHPSIAAGQAMLQQIAQEQGFEIAQVLQADTDAAFVTAANLAEFELIFHMNCTGDIFNAEQRQAFEDWVTNNGAFAGVHSATDTEAGWDFYKELTGQYYDLHDPCCSPQNIQWTQEGLAHFTVQGLPSPWNRSEEWYKFNSAASWTTKEGFTVLSNVTTNNQTRPVSYVREFSTFRSFYTSLGHEDAAFQDAMVKEHVARGIMWAVRREAEYQ